MCLPSARAGPLDLIQPRCVADVEQPIHLRHVPAEPARDLRLA
jgi:hypothetical protein